MCPPDSVSTSVDPYPLKARSPQTDAAIDLQCHASYPLRLDQMGDAHPGVNLLRTIPGVGPRTAEAVTAYIDDPGRFRRMRAIGSYFGLVPCQDQSAGKNHLGRITKTGPATVRKLLIEASWQSIRRCDEAREFFERVMRSDPDRRKIALVARDMGAMLTGLIGETPSQSEIDDFSAAHEIPAELQDLKKQYNSIEQENWEY